MVEDALKTRVIGKPFQPGNTAGHGRPPRISCVSSLLAELIKGDTEKVKEKWVKETKGHPTGGMLIAMAMFKKMANGDLTACKEGLDRVEGKVKERVDVTSNNECIVPKPSLLIQMPDGQVVTSQKLAGVN